jgi:hypothetical protein
MTPAARQLARIAVDDETWRSFRQVAILRDLSITEYLGRLVQRELRRRADRLIAGVSPDQHPQEQALVALADLRLAIDELDEVAGRLARSAVANGASWRDVASSLRLSSDAARQAYAGDPSAAPASA